MRRVVIGRDPLCKRCGMATSWVADHIVPAGVVLQQARDSGLYPLDRNAGFYFLSNLQGLCYHCHYLKTDEDKAHVGMWPNVADAGSGASKRVWTF